MKISNELSAYLDFLRFTAALAVLLGHMAQDGLAIQWIPLSNFSHEAVIIFFVLSGFIIQSNTHARNPSAADYSIARFSRIYSVTLPAILFSIAVAELLVLIGVDRFPEGHHRFSWLDLLGSISFLNESWNSPTQLTLNHPFWSLCYEVWFYVLFGLYCYAKGRLRWPLLLLAAVFAGPAVLALFPIWCLGAWTAGIQRNGTLRIRRGAMVLFMLAPMLMVILNHFEIDTRVQASIEERVPALWRLENSQRFLTDYLLSLALCLNILAFPSLPKGFREFFARHKNVLMQLAGFSFTLYLFHRPMTKIAGEYLPEAARGSLPSFILLLAILMACWIISLYTERQLPWWRAKTKWVFSALEGIGSRPTSR
ncbi:acyltransferase family protein [Pseudorhodoferax sp.]|uniref:acyltransferase family protein n=1 Tax=Pseudorhodoferax sp. TaxID=1993553 RepID=UPI0039E2887F